MRTTYNILKRAEREKPDSINPVAFLNDHLNTALPNEMVELYQTARTLLIGINCPIVQFTGIQFEDGSAAIAREFSRTVAVLTKKPTLLLDLCKENGGDLPETENLHVRSVPSIGFLSGEAGFFDALKAEFGFIIIDSPPLGISPLGLPLIREADGIILVVEAGKTRLRAAQIAKQRIKTYGGKLLGTVLTGYRTYTPKWIKKCCT